MIEDCDTVDIVKYIINLFSEALGEEEDRVITVGTGVGQPTGYASGGLGIQCQAVAGNLSLKKLLLVERLIANVVNCWDTLKRAISSLAYAVMRLKVQRLEAESL